MPRLTVHPVGEYPYLSPTPPYIVHRIPAFRVLATLLIGQDPPPGLPDDREEVQAIVDTGAPISVFPRVWWEPYRSMIQFLNPAMGPVGAPLPTATVAGGVGIPYQLGRLWMGVVDADERRLRAVPIVAQFLMQSPVGLRRPLVGLRGGVLDGRWLRRISVPMSSVDQEWWLTEH